MMIKNVEDVLEIVNIYDTLSPEGDPDLTEIDGADEPIHIFIVDNDEKKFTPIRAKQMEIKFLSTAEINLSSFITPEDNRWYVIYMVNGDVQFKGFLVLDDVDEDFLDSDTSNVVTLIATDNIGLLKDLPLTNLQGENPRGYFTIIQYIAWALAKTGLQLPINVVHNVKEEHYPDRVMYMSIYLQSKTFEADINLSLNCYEVLSLILGNDCFLTQSIGEWHIIRIDELQDDESINNRFDYQGNLIEIATFNPNQLINPDGDIFFTGKATFVKVQMPVKDIQLTYDYDYPKEIIDNIDFSRDTDDPYFTEDFVEDGVNKTRKRYKLKDWTLLKNFAGDPADTTAYIERIFEGTYEKERYAVIAHSAAGGYYYLKSNKIPFGEKDKFVFSADARFNDDIGGAGSYTHQLAQIRLYGSDGSFWILDNPAGDDHPVWKGSNSSFSVNNGYVFIQGRLEETQKDWATGSVEAPPVPVGGEIEVLLLHSAVSNSLDKYFQNIRFDYIPYINGSYSKYRGQYNKVSQALNTKKVYEETVKISDSPKRLFKGALHIQTSWDDFLTAITQITAADSKMVIEEGAGNVAAQFPVGSLFVLTDTVNNNGYYKVLTSNFDGFNTNLTVQKTWPPTPIVNEIPLVALFGRPVFGLAGGVYDGKQFRDAVPDPAYIHPFSYNQAFSVWNQYNRPFRIFDFQLQGLNKGGLLPDIIHKYKIAEDSPHANHKLFMMLHIDQDHRICEWKGVMIEFFDTTIAKDYASAFTFRYISDQN